MAPTLSCPSLAQTHMQGPLKVNGSGKSLTREELDQVKQELEEFKAKHNVKEPDRSFMNEPNTMWMFGGAPDYSLTNLLFLKGRTKHHKEGSLELTVENLVKTWEMERSHKPDAYDHRTVDYSKFAFSANGGKVFENIESHQVGNYNVLLDTCPKELYDAENTSWHEAHDKFHLAFAAFPWEVLDVYSPPPRVAFSWRHWAEFTGSYEGNQGKGELIEVFGFCTANVNEKLQLTELEVYYNSVDFISVLKGLKKVEDTNHSWKGAAGCPHLQMGLQPKEETKDKL